MRTLITAATVLISASAYASSNFPFYADAKFRPLSEATFTKAVKACTPAEGSYTDACLLKHGIRSVYFAPDDNAFKDGITNKKLNVKSLKGCIWTGPADGTPYAKCDLYP